MTVVTQPELRMILTGAKQSGAVEVYEQDMIEGVLDMQTTEVHALHATLRVAGVTARDLP